MPIKDYGVWVAYPISQKAETAEEDSKSPHLSLFYDDSPDVAKGKYRAAINIKSVGNEARLVYWFNRDFKSPNLDFLKGLSVGFTKLPAAERNGLDYIRGNILQVEKGTLVEHDIPGHNNDIIDYLTPILNQAITQKAKIFLFGEPFSSGDGIHDVHMNQGNSEAKFLRYNGVFQDGGLVISFPDGHFEAVFLAFAVQKIHTDDVTGNPIGDTDFAALLDIGGGQRDGDEKERGGRRTEPPPPPAVPGKVIIRAALVNPVGPDQTPSGEPEKVYLNNRTSEAVNLDGWSIINRAGQSQKLEGLLEALGERTFLVPDAPLSNKGGIITLLNDAGLKVDGVSYTAEEAKREGLLLYFH